MRCQVVMSFLLSSIFCVAFGNSIATPLKSFQDWKKEKIQTALVQTNLIRAQILKAQTENNPKLQESLERQLNQVRWNSEVARDLSVTDYFVLYLSQQNQPDRFQQAAQRMTTSEVAELIEAYTGILGFKKTELAVEQNVINSASKAPAISAQAVQQK